MTGFEAMAWMFRISQGIPEVLRLAEQHQGQPEYTISSAKDAWSIFIEYSSQHKALTRTTEEDGEQIEDMFLKQWAKQKGARNQG